MHQNTIKHQQSNFHCPEADLFRGPKVKKTDHIVSRWGGGNKGLLNLRISEFRVIGGLSQSSNLGFTNVPPSPAMHRPEGHV